MRKWLLPLFLFTTVSGFSQLSDAYKELKDFSQRKEIVPLDSSIDLTIYYKKNLHYLYPLYKAFYQEQSLLKIDTGMYIDNLAQALSLTGDHASVLELEKTYRPKLPAFSKKEIDTLTSTPGAFSYTDAKKYILNRAKSTRVVMINEAHDKPQHRAFTASLLEELYQQGFRYLAMEMLSNRRRIPITKPDVYSGYYTAEPIAGELIRKAVELGYTLVPYEDTIPNHSLNQREYSQALNLVNFLKQHDSTAKMIVHAGYGHIEETAQSSSRIPMAVNFKNMTGIDPLTIDQTQMTENSVNNYGAFVYDTWLQRHPAVNSVIALSDNKPFDVFGLDLYDICVIHPPTKYINARPAWVTMNGWKKELTVPAAFRSAFLLQAYYADEYTAATVNQSVPADQTYQVAQNGLYYLYLRKGKYKLVFRDKAYEILGTKEVEVN